MRLSGFHFEDILKVFPSVLLTFNLICILLPEASARNTICTWGWGWGFQRITEQEVPLLQVKNKILSLVTGQESKLCKKKLKCQRNIIKQKNKIEENRRPLYFRHHACSLFQLWRVPQHAHNSVKKRFMFKGTLMLSILKMLLQWAVSLARFDASFFWTKKLIWRGWI